ncbi:putative redox protein [Lishizhenia tianjinensis]|uniref:Putative redox protein n=1 Tax=Lishizhenia tianjinensis TaxID=477690 RepID=A0A1I6YRL2_9FLAO|nr:OsmC family protein [Lishizhenia tianjinensis]SFT53106.1 putative redox protein [Lishizhenia tianjinensis]
MKLSLVKEQEKLDFNIYKAGDLVGRSTASAAVGGSDDGLRPMEMFASSLALCTSIDTVHILNKQRIFLEHFEVNIEAERVKDQVPAIFKEIILEFVITEEEHLAKVAKAVNLSINKYCSVRNMIKDEVKIETKIRLKE